MSKSSDRVTIRRKIAAKYDTSAEKEVISWFDQLLGIKLEPGVHKMEKQLKDGQALLKLAQKVQSDTPNCPKEAKDMALKISTNSMPFQQMANIQMFLLFCENYGIPKTGLFHPGDLFHGNNIQQVLCCIQQLGSECQRNQFPGPCIGPKPLAKNIREFTDEQLKAGESIIGMQAKGATQLGTTIWSARHLADKKATTKDSTDKASEEKKDTKIQEDKDTAKEQDKDTAKKQDEDTANKPDKDTTKKQDKDTAKKQDKDTAKKQDKDTAKVQDKDTAKKPDKDTAKKPDKDTARKQDKDTAKKPDKDTSKKQDKDIAKKHDEDTAKKQDKDTARKQDKDRARKQDKDTAKKQDEDKAKKQDEDKAKKQDEDKAKKQDEDKAKKQDEDTAKKQDEDTAAKKSDKDCKLTNDVKESEESSDEDDTDDDE